MSPLLTLTLQIAVVLGATSLTARLFRTIGQPRVVGEMFAGIVLGPSVLGFISPGLSQVLFASPSLPFLNALSQVGIVIYMFLVGMDINVDALRKHGHTAVMTSHVSIAAPLFLGVVLAVVLYPRLADDTVGFSAFALFVGTAMSITAFPVLARILTEQRLVTTKIGTLVLACAAVDDLTGWCILAYVVWLVRMQQDHVMRLWVTLLGLTTFVAFMFGFARHRLRHFAVVHAKHRRLPDSTLATMMFLVFMSAAATEALGLHMLFGAFFMGTMMPKDDSLVAYVKSRLETVTVIVLLPLYFTFTGLRTQVRLVTAPDVSWLFLMILAAAIAGKLGGSMLAARCSGCSWRESTAIGALMNTRGLMELVVLNIGLDIGVISPAMFSMMVLMALVTTVMAVPMFKLAMSPRAPLRADASSDTTFYNTTSV